MRAVRELSRARKPAASPGASVERKWPVATQRPIAAKEPAKDFARAFGLVFTKCRADRIGLYAALAQRRAELSFTARACPTPICNRRVTVAVEVFADRLKPVLATTANKAASPWQRALDRLAHTARPCPKPAEAVARILGAAIYTGNGPAAGYSATGALVRAVCGAWGERRIGVGIAHKV